MDEIKLSTVKISQKGISEINGNKDSVFVPREHIHFINLLYGCGAQRPIMQTVLGTALTLIPLYFFLPPLLEIINFQDNAGSQSGGNAFKFIVLPLMFAPFGIFFLMEVFVKTFYLIIKTETENKKIVFQDKVSQPELYQFIEQANNDFGYSITSELKNHT